MDKIKQLEIKKLLKELDYVESDFEYKSEIISENDSKFMRDVNKFLEKHPNLKEMFDKKINDKIQDILNKNKKNDNTDIIKREEEDVIDTEDTRTDSDSDKNDAQEGAEKEEDIQSAEEDEIKENIKSPKIKKLYREIVKLTHPDRVKNKRLNDLYLKATDFYDKNDIAGIYDICSELKIEYDMDEEDAVNIMIKIKTLKDRIGFVESTFTWKWHYCKTDQERDQLIYLYIRTQIQ